MQFLKKIFSLLWRMVWKRQKKTEKDIIIAVVGGTGAGMSSVIHAVTNDYKHGIGAKGVLKPCTQKVLSIKIQNQNTNSTMTHPITLLDTPGIDGNRKTSRMVSNDIKKWMIKNCQPNVKLGGVIYVNNITNPMDPETTPDLFITKTQATKLCGDDWRDRVMLVNTHWDVGGSDFKEKKTREKLWTQKMREYLYDTTGTVDSDSTLCLIVYRFPQSESHDLVQELILPLVGLAPRKDTVVENDDDEPGRLLSSADRIDSSATIVQDHSQVHKETKDILGVETTPMMNIPGVAVPINNSQREDQEILRLRNPPSSARFHIL